MDTSIPVPTHQHNLAQLAYDIPGVTKVSTLGRSTVYRALKDGSLRSIVVGRRRLVMADDLVAWLRSHAVER